MTRPPMTFEQQAELLEHLCAKAEPSPDGRPTIMLMLPMEQALIDDLNATAMRLRRMAPHETAIREVVTGR